MNLSIWKQFLRAPYGAAVALSILLQGCLMAVVSPLIPIILTEKIGLDKSQVIVFFLLFTLMSAVIVLGTGWLSDGIIARYKLVLVGGLVGSLGFIGLSQATLPIHTWIAGLAIAQLGVIFPQMFAVAKAGVVAGWERGAQVMGLTALRTMFSLGFVIGTAISSGLAQFDIRLVFMVMALVNFVVTLSAAYLLYRIEPHIQQQAQRSAENGAASRVSVQRSLPLWVLIVPLLAMLLLRGADSTRNTYLPLVTFQLFKDASIAPIMFGLSAAAELVMMSVMGFVAGKTGEKVAISIGAVVGALYYVVMSYSQSLPLLYAGNVVYAVFTGATAGVAMVYLQNLMAHRAGLGGSLYMTVFNVGNLIGILAPLLVHDYDQTIFIAPIILCLAAAVLLMLGDRTAQVEKRMSSTAVVVDAGQEVLVVE